VHAVGTREANPFGLHNIHGNVWEWVQDWYGPYGPNGERGVDAGGPATGDRRVLRGGSFADEPEHLRSAIRNWGRPSVTNRYVGLRVARGARPEPLAR
jgi:formylglycine-generating enzyme required for sulfatase activity